MRLGKILSAVILMFCLLMGAFSASATSENQSGIQVKYQQLILNDALTMRFDIAVDNGDLDTASVNVNVADKAVITNQKIGELPAGKAGCYQLCVNLAAVQLADTVTLELVSDGQIVSTKQYKAVDYANTIFAGDYSAETKALVGAMLHYGAAAQTYFNYNTDNLANAGLTAEEVNVPQWTETAIVSGCVPGIQFYGASLLLESRVAVRFYFMAQSLAGIDFGAYTPVEKNGMYYVEIPGINPQDYDKTVSVTVTDGSEEMTVTYSPMAYILRKYAAYEAGALKNLTAAMYQYHNAAKAYVAKGEDVVTDGNGIVIEQLVISGENSTAVVPAGTQLEEDVTTLTLSTTPMTETGSDVTVGENEQMVSWDVHISGISAENTVPIIVTLDQLAPEFLNQGNIALYHVEDGVTVEMTRVYSLDALDAHNEYYYDIATGTVTVAMVSFSEVLAVANEENLWNGVSDTNWYNDNDTKFEIFNADQLAGLGKLVDEGNTFAGKTITVHADINLKGYAKNLTDYTDGERIIFNPIGYSYEKINNGMVFKGTFDGNGHTIYGLYQQGWDLEAKTDEDYTYSMAGGGLFASIVDATIKNVTIDHADIVMECVDMGIVVGYANGTCNFENIIVKNSTIQNYNRCTGGVIGEIGGGGTYTLNNVDVEASTTISALWGTFDPPMGGLIGGKWGEAGSRGEGNGTTEVSVTMKKCDVACKIDAYNDVTSAYQWYSYRRAGMLIGDTEESKTVNGRTEATASWLTTENCTVSYGDWVNYTYCEFKNTTSLDARYPWVRVQAGLSNSAYSNPRYGRPTFAEPTVVNWDDHKEEDHIAGDGHDVLITFHQLYGGGQGCYGGNTHVDLKLGVTEINAPTPIQKFKIKNSFNETITNGTKVTLGELFEAVAGDTKLQALDVIAYVSPVTEKDTVRATFDKQDDWKQSALTFTGFGRATIVIQDYFYCEPTVMHIYVFESDAIESNTLVGMWADTREGTRYSAEAAFNSNLDAFWNPSAALGYPQTPGIVYTLNKTYDLTQIKLIHKNRQYYYTIAVSTDGETYTNIATVEEATAGDYYFADSISTICTLPVDAKNVNFIKITFTGNDDPDNVFVTLCAIDIQGTESAEQIPVEPTEQPESVQATITDGTPFGNWYNSREDSLTIGPGMAYDADETTFWNPVGGDESNLESTIHGKSIIFTLDDTYDLTKLSVLFKRVHYFQIMVSEDGKTYTELANIIEDNQGTYYTKEGGEGSDLVRFNVNIRAQNVKYVMLVFTGREALPNYAALCDIKVYGIAGNEN